MTDNDRDAGHPEPLVPALAPVVPLVGDDDPVLDGRLVRSPREATAVYGNDDVRRWDVNALGRPAGRSRQWGVIDFGDLSGSWLVTAKDLALILLDPENARLVSRHVFIRQKPASPGTVRYHVQALRSYFDVGRWHGYPADIRAWNADHFAEAVAHLEEHEPVSEQRLRHLERVPRLLFALRDLIVHAPTVEPWTTIADSPFEGRFSKRSELRTQPVDPDLYFPLIDSAMTYVDVFSVDIIQAIENLRGGERKRSEITGKDLEGAIADFLDDPHSTIPVYRHPAPDASDHEWAESINWALLSLLSCGRKIAAFNPARPEGRQRRAHAIRRARSGGALLGGTLVPRARLDEQREPWVDGLSPTQLQNEARLLRTACYIVIAGLTMMRDSEVQSIRRGSVTMFAGTLAVKSSLVKGHEDQPTAHWWITDPVKRAIDVAERISTHPSHLFASSRETKGKDAAGIYATQGLKAFRNRVNLSAERWGLTRIGDGKITPHMLRRTMALITEWERGGQVATAHQLKHASLTARSNALTGAYTAPTQRWSDELRERQAQHNAQDALDQLALAYPESAVGPGASRMAAASSAPGAVLDTRARGRMLAAHFPDLQVGTANLCLGDRLVAQCLPPELRDGSEDIRTTLCDPTRCANSVILPLQRDLWREEEQTLLTMRRTSRLSPHMRAIIDSRSEDVRRITKEFQ